MSMWVTCPRCGKPKEEPAFEGDGVFSRHDCQRSDESAGDEVRHGGRRRRDEQNDEGQHDD